MMGNVLKKHPQIKSGGQQPCAKSIRPTGTVGAPWRGWADRSVPGRQRWNWMWSIASGGGDGYAAGFFYGLLAGESPDEAVRLGWAHGALITTFPGDTTMATLEQCEGAGQRRFRADSAVNLKFGASSNQEATAGAGGDGRPHVVSASSCCGDEPSPPRLPARPPRGACKSWQLLGL